MRIMKDIVTLFNPSDPDSDIAGYIEKLQQDNCIVDEFGYITTEASGTGTVITTEILYRKPEKLTEK